MPSMPSIVKISARRRRPQPPPHPAAAQRRGALRSRAAGNPGHGPEHHLHPPLATQAGRPGRRPPHRQKQPLPPRRLTSKKSALERAPVSDGSAALKGHDFRRASSGLNEAALGPEGSSPTSTASSTSPRPRQPKSPKPRRPSRHPPRPAKTPGQDAQLL